MKREERKKAVGLGRWGPVLLRLRTHAAAAAAAAQRPHLRRGLFALLPTAPKLDPNKAPPPPRRRPPTVYAIETANRVA